jgi:hypothetical protein
MENKRDTQLYAIVCGPIGYTSSPNAREFLTGVIYMQVSKIILFGVCSTKFPKRGAIVSLPIFTPNNITGPMSIV